MNVAITGACGLVGAHLAAALSAEHRVIGFDRHPWWGTRPIALHEGDLADPRARAAFIEDARPDLLIHCAAMVNVDACEERPADAYFANGTLTRLIAQAASEHCRLVYLTTDGIFPGDTPMQCENDLPCPRTVYGRSKLHGEWETRLARRDHLIVRTNFYGWSSGAKATAAEWLYRALEKGESITLYDDFWFTPIYVVALVERVLALIGGGHTGIFNVVGGERVSKYDFGMRLAHMAGFADTCVNRGSIADAAFTAPRPRDMSLDAGKVVTTIGMPAPDCTAGIRDFLADKNRTLEERVRGIRVL